MHPLKLSNPKRVLAEGNHAGHEWIVTHNGIGYRCGYVHVKFGHPWAGKDYNDVNASVHGGLTYGELDVDEGGYWFGFDCAHIGDAPDPALPTEHKLLFHDGCIIRDQEYVESQCRELCEQALAASNLT